MTTYFIAGYSDFPNNQGRWEFWRVLNWTDNNTPQEAIQEIVKSMENDPSNFRSTGYGSPYTIQGKIMITAFNRV